MGPWRGTTSEIHPHVWAAIFLGGVICSFPLFLISKWPGQPLRTRHSVAIAQLFTSALFIHSFQAAASKHIFTFFAVPWPFWPFTGIGASW